MNIRQMQIFRALCEELNFTKTAARLNMTQPAVSHVVAELERETGTPLFDRIGRRIYLTAAGKLLLEKSPGCLSSTMTSPPVLPAKPDFSRLRSAPA